ncbi:ring-1,2-phenylacetyl-CoA epoxidase subunit PaaE [Mucilaginibacter frigoritolerans]|uniref:Ring-1,2-phenylacetyl-CoA epoxidase subunit PaaE n=1 Tax=Mucilaginibacter frigoritolerans TaxID=652788 RepID=A0A562TVP2_9SPHI|nr:ferredoxin--NADP reductase [Mucilaginibacter frigoritolerans]TWI97146.1 ring-1,2-phenylacetyl-CoA epoxidase subunit PaaE [Mucilaginibacter frigoritolerans]
MLQLRVEAIKQELSGTATFYLSELSGKKITYKAGQFITLVFTHHEEEIRRSYSLSSSPDEELLAITVKRIDNGEISRFMLTKIKPGDVLNAVEPAGKFVINKFNDEKDILLFAAGSGIVPIYAQLKYILRREGKSRLTLICSNQNSQSILFKNDLNELQQKHADRFKIIQFLSDEANRLNNLLVEKLVRENISSINIPKAEFYTCGPFSYMRMIRLTLLFMGIEAGQIRKENFVLETIPVTPSTTTFAPRNIRIHFNHEIHDLVVGENQSILQAALQNNIPLPYSCRVGDCSTCSAVCKSGKVEMVKNDVLTDADLAEGWILTCTGHPLTDNVVIAF